MLTEYPRVKRKLRQDLNLQLQLLVSHHAPASGPDHERDLCRVRPAPADGLIFVASPKGYSGHPAVEAAANLD